MDEDQYVARLGSVHLCRSNQASCEDSDQHYRTDLKGSSAATLYSRARASAATACCGSTLPRESRLRSAWLSRELLAARSAGDPRDGRPGAGFSGEVAALR